ncbi:MAG: DUF2520 domain-containing protein [Bacteroidales bacterium]|nr:DUF2520 domain-containing protein [Bacteroidales bacterium]
MKIVFIGAGNVATHLAKAMSAAGHSILQMWSRDIRHAAESAADTGAVAIDKLDNLDKSADFYIIAVPDDHISAISAQLPSVAGIVLHTSGSVSLDAIAHLRRGVLWFPHSFVKGTEMSYDNLQCCYEGSSAEVEAALQALLHNVARSSYRLDSTQRRWAHLASVVTNNFCHALNTLGEQIMNQHNMDFAMLRPLILSTAERAMQSDLAARQTGPAARHDEKTMQAHRQMLESMPEAQKAYVALSDLIQSFQKSSGSR